MIEDIKITQYGEYLHAYQVAEWNDDYEESSHLSSTIGTHVLCDGFIDIKEVSQTHNVLSCRACGLRFYIPIKVDTYGKLRKYMKSEVG